MLFAMIGSTTHYILLSQHLWMSSFNFTSSLVPTFRILNCILCMRTKSFHYCLGSYLTLHQHQTFFSHDCNIKCFNHNEINYLFLINLEAITSQWDIGIPFVMLVTWTFKSDIFSLSFHTYQEYVIIWS